MEPFLATIVQNTQVSFSAQQCVRHANTNNLLRCRINEDSLAKEVIVLLPAYGKELHTNESSLLEEALRSRYPVDQMQR